jgi:hypothetical protein
MLKDPLTGFPFYVGKGNANRPYEHFDLVKSGKKATSYRLTSFLKKMINENREPIIEIVGENLSNSEAMILETSLIAQFGRVDYECFGILLNHRLTQNDWTGKNHSPEAKAKISASRKGKTLSAEHRQKLIQVNTGKKHKPRTEHWKQMQRKSHLGRKDTPATTEKKQLAQAGLKNPRAKLWTLEKEDGTLLEIVALKTWCRESNISFDALCRTRKSKCFYEGLRVL